MKYIQIWARIKNFFPTFQFYNSCLLEERKLLNKLKPIIKSNQSLFNNFEFIFLNKKFKFNKLKKWHNQKLEKLWLYNLHYFDDLNAYGSKHRKKIHVKLIENWVDQNPIGSGIGWDPYPCSLRIVNWIKWSLLGNELTNKWKQSLINQTKFLNRNFEYHILGNHLTSNAKALIYSGLYFKGELAVKWYKKGIRIFNKELQEQVLLDGGHFELSPMYHALFLQDLLDIINIHKVYKKKIPRDFILKVNLMTSWLNIMRHPDNRAPFFNDCAHNIGPGFNQLKAYARRLGIKFNEQRSSKLEHLKDSGYIKITLKNFVAILDVAKIGPDYLPGHAHADSLSFEVSLFNHRLFVNSGISKYEISKIRNFERSTKAHNTVMVNNENSSEVWSGFRVAKRAYPVDLKIKEFKKFIKISCGHDGYKKLVGQPIHKRDWYFSKNFFVVKDKIIGPYQKADAYFHFHPSVVISRKSLNLWNLKIAGKTNITLKVEMGNSKLKKSYYSPEFGKKMINNCLKVCLGNHGSSIRVSWN